MYKAVFLDLDDTLLDNEKKISNENIEAIKYVKQKGGLVFIASGRQIESTKKYHKLANAGRYIIFSNGAGIFDCDVNAKLFSTDIDKEICSILYNYAMENNLGIRMDTPFGRYVSDEKYALRLDIALKKEEWSNIILNNDILQISFLTEIEEKIEELIDFVKQNIPTSIKIEDVFKTGYKEEFFAINIVNTNASKGNAIKQLCKFLKIDIKDVIAIGDGLNDMSMIKVAGLGVAMGNSNSEVKSVADIVTTTNLENGVAKILRENF